MGIRQKTFIGNDYISLRAKINRWLEKNPNIRVLNTSPIERGLNKRRIVVQYVRGS